MDSVRNEEVRMRAGIEMELASSGSESTEIVWARRENGRVPYG